MSSYNTSSGQIYHNPKYSAMDIMQKAKARLIESSVGMAGMLLQLELIEDNSFDTMATDGKVIKFNGNFVLSLPMEEITAVIIHETLHVVWGHHLRMGRRNANLWNIACDYAINNYIHDVLRQPLPTGGLIDVQKYGKDSAEKIYSTLMNDDEALNDLINEDSDSEDSEEQEDQDNQGGGQQSEDQNQSEEENITGQEFSGGSQSDEEGDQRENPKDSSGGTSASGEVDLNELPSFAGAILPATDEDGQALSDDEIKEQMNVLDAQVMVAQKLEKGIGNGGGVDYLGGREAEITQVSVSWEDEMADFLSATKSDSNSWSRLNRRHQHRGINLPTKKSEPTIKKVAMMVDVSCSTDHERDDYVTNAMDLFEQYQVEVLAVNRFSSMALRNAKGEYWETWDTTQGDSLPDKDEFPSAGSGGTRFTPPFNAFHQKLEDNEDYDAIIVFTDGYGYVDAEVEPDIPVLWICSEQSEYSEDLPFGKVVYMNK